MGWSATGLTCGDDFIGYVFRAQGGVLAPEHCSLLQANLVARAINVPGRPYVAAQPASEILAMADDDGFVSVAPDLGSGQCVALVKAAIPALGAARPHDKPNWRKLDAVTADNVAAWLPGTAIGYGFDADGLYQGFKTGNHVAILVGVRNGRGQLLDQWRHSETRLQKAMVHDIDFVNHRWSVLTRVQ